MITKPVFYPIYLIRTLVPIATWTLAIFIILGISNHIESGGICQIDETSFEPSEWLPNADAARASCLKSFDNVKLMGVITPILLGGFSTWFFGIYVYRTDARGYQWAENQSFKCHECNKELDDDNFTYFIPKKIAICTKCADSNHGGYIR